MRQTRDHGGNLDAAIGRYGGSRADWLDLSTGINPDAYPLPDLPSEVWAVLPQRDQMADLCDAAAAAYGTSAQVVPMNGAQGAIQFVPYLRHSGRAAVLAPTYNEHAAALISAGWQVAEVGELAELDGADLAIVVNPNNPDGRTMTPLALRDLADRVGLLIVDESFVDPEPHLSLVTDRLPSNAVVLRSFGKFYGLAGLRIGFALATDKLADRLVALAGPWPVSGPGITIASQALQDETWRRKAIKTLIKGAEKLDALAARHQWRLIGGTTLFRTYDVRDAAVVQQTLASYRVWSRIFPYSESWVRLGLPPKNRWPQLERAFEGVSRSLSG